MSHLPTTYKSQFRDILDNLENKSIEGGVLYLRDVLFNREIRELAQEIGFLVPESFNVSAVAKDIVQYVHSTRQTKQKKKENVQKIIIKLKSGEDIFFDINFRLSFDEAFDIVLNDFMKNGVANDAGNNFSAKEIEHVEIL